MEIVEMLFFRVDTGDRKTDHRRNEDNRGKVRVTDKTDSRNNTKIIITCERVPGYRVLQILHQYKSKSG